MSAEPKYLASLLMSMMLTGFGMPIVGQDRCGVIEQTEIRRNKKSLFENEEHFEKWLKERKESEGTRSQAAAYRIPIVVHIIHKGEAEGSGTNISDAQVNSQIAVLNRDFNRLNTDASNTPAEFQSVAGSVKIEFVLATQSPDGLYTTGIRRAKGTKNQWTVNDDEMLKALSYWPAEGYFNIWVTDLSATLLGYAQFPIADLDGLEDAEDNRLTDGVVVDYSVFGSDEDGTFNLTTNFNKGRTATHEVGHFLGLRHIWGDDDGACGGNNDYVSDTPDQANSTTGCPSNPKTSCSVHTMFQNYMDYSNDACMNLFTMEQAGRMVTVLGNSPRRTSLLSSAGLNPLHARDLGIAEILSPNEGMCSGTMAPAIKIKNYGTDEATSARFQLTINGTVVETKQVSFSPVLETSETSEITFTPMSLSSGSYEIDFQVILTNGSSDEGIENNNKTITTLVPYMADVPLTESFTTLPEPWGQSNADGRITWTIQTAVKESANNTAAYLNFFQYADADGEIDALTTPIMDLSVATAPYLSFDVAYAKRGSMSDGLKVYVLTGCESDVTVGTQIYSKQGSALATTSTHTASFEPTGEDEWRKEIIDLSAYVGQSRVQLAFVGINDNGNNLYIDNVMVVKEVFENVAITRIISPTPVSCKESAIPKVVVANAGIVTISSLVIRYTVNNETEQLFDTTKEFLLLPGMDTTIALPEIQLELGNNTFSVEATEPNSVKDIDTTDNQKVISIIVNTASDIIPLRENFDKVSYQDAWSIVNPAGGSSWDVLITNYNQSMYFNAVDDPSNTDEAWLATPVFDFSEIETVSMFFDLAHGPTGNGNRTVGAANLKILASLDCGSTYEKVVFDGSQESFAPEGALVSVPDTADDWATMHVNLNELAGSSQVRLAFVIANGGGNTTYIDNIEFFLSDDQTPQAATNPFIVYGTDLESPQDFFVTFNLDQRQDVVYDLVDMLGRVILTQELQDVLNQTYTVASNDTSTGIYILRVRIGDTFYTNRVFIGH